MQKLKDFIHLYRKSSYIFEKKFQDIIQSVLPIHNIGNTDS